MHNVNEPTGLSRAARTATENRKCLNGHKWEIVYRVCGETGAAEEIIEGEEYCPFCAEENYEY